jgi:hypothetical protein
MGSDIIGKCWNCGTGLGAHDYGRENGCLKCGKPTRVCRNCRWYAPGRPNACEEPVAESVMEKERANFCSFFEPAAEPGQEGEQESPDGLRQAAEDLFKF